ncbi:MAG: sensor histidine kinase [Pacificimonas sp.]|nr:sensor histidine kinase [Pacificimonas sp.]
MIDTDSTKPLANRILTALTIGLAPLGILAAFLSYNGYLDAQSAFRADVQEDARRIASEVDTLVLADGRLLRTIAVRYEDSLATGGETRCTQDLSALVQRKPLFSQIRVYSLTGTALCSSGPDDTADTGLFSAAQRALDDADDGTALLFDRERGGLVYAATNDIMGGRTGSIIAARIPMEEMRRRFASIQREIDANVTLQVAQEGEARAAREVAAFGTDPGVYGVVAPTQLPGLSVRYSEPTPPLPPRRLATILLPPLMWLAALVIVWFTLKQVVLKPMNTMREGLRKRADTGTATALAPQVGGTAEFVTFAGAFDRMTARQRLDRESLEAALEKQQRLVREVHHRVKNNLQIVTSLLSIKGRAAEDVAERSLYGAIQMRVEALALVHRWLYADDESIGVDLAALLGDLTATLEHGIDTVYGISGRFETDLDRVYVTQDTAVPLAFLVTELVAGEASMLTSGGEMEAEITLKRRDDHVVMTVAGKDFTGSRAASGGSGSGSTSGSANADGRIVQGMARQLRGDLAFDAGANAYTVTFPAELVVK